MLQSVGDGDEGWSDIEGDGDEADDGENSGWSDVEGIASNGAGPEAQGPKDTVVEIGGALAPV
jgi:hypothetical protein